MRIFDSFMLSTIIWDCKMLEVYQVSEAIRHHTVHFVLKQENSDDLAICVACDPVPVILARVSHQPIFIDSPPISLSSIVKINKRRPLTWACISCTPVHIACWPFMIVRIHQLIWRVCYIIWRLIWIWQLHQRVIRIIEPYCDRFRWGPFLIQYRLCNETQIIELKGV